jgi:hypothetical protein
LLPEQGFRPLAKVGEALNIAKVQAIAMMIFIGLRMSLSIPSVSKSKGA